MRCGYSRLPSGHHACIMQATCSVYATQRSICMKADIFQSLYTISQSLETARQSRKDRPMMNRNTRALIFFSYSLLLAVCLSPARGLLRPARNSRPSAFDGQQLGICCPLPGKERQNHRKAHPVRVRGREYRPARLERRDLLGDSSVQRDFDMERDVQALSLQGRATHASRRDPHGRHDDRYRVDKPLELRLNSRTCRMTKSPKDGVYFWVPMPSLNTSFSRYCITTLTCTCSIRTN
jgi:hypothetical protein